MTKEAVGNSYMPQRCNRDVADPSTDPAMQLCINEGLPLPRNYFETIQSFATSAQVRGWPCIGLFT